MTITRLLRQITLLMLCVIMTQLAFSQTKTITGKITDDKGNPIQGATITVRGSKVGTSTDASGAFSLNVPANAKTLVISSVGFSEQEIAMQGKESFDVSLVAAASSLSDVVVVGYGTARKKDLTGAVAKVGAKEFNQGVVTNPIAQIQGKVAGLVITTPGGDPNQAPIIRLRGQTSLTGGQTPLIVLDGIPLDFPDLLNNIPPGDIESYDILKDASAAAIYGSRGANGVIIVNTKKGTAGKPQVSYNGYVGIQKVAKYLDMLSPNEWRAATGAAGAGIDKGANTDWQKAITQTGMVHSHDVAISGGSKGFTYRGSVNYLNQQGVVINSGKEEYGLRFNAQQKALDDKLEINLGIINTTTNRTLTNYTNITKAFNDVPVYPVRNPDGSYYAFTDFEVFNPVEHINEEYNKSFEHLNLLNGTINYELIKGLKVGATGSVSHFNQQTHFFQPAYPVEGNVNNASDGNYNTDSRKGDLHINYLKDFGQHTIGFTGVYEYNYFTNDYLTATGSNFLVPQNLDNNFTSAIDPTKVSAGSYKEEYKLISFLGRLNYNYAGKYYVTASLREDGSSKFGKNNRHGYFPSFDVAWRISRESFMKNIGWLDDLKLRAGYGVTGNSDAITPYATLLLYGPGGRYYDAVNNIYPQSYSPIQNPNPDLKWEERHGKNIGLDFSILNSRFSGDINYFSDKTINLLYNQYQVPTPPFYIPYILANVGSMTNKGLEFSLTARVIQDKKLSWTINGQITFIKTRISSLSGTFEGYPIRTDQIPGSSAVGRGLSSYPITYFKPGYAPNVFYLPHFVGVDKNGNQLVDSAGTTGFASSANVDKFYTDPSPDFTYGINNTFTYGKWSLNFFLRGVHGQKFFNNTSLDFANVNRLPGNNATKEALTNGIKDAAAVSDLWLQKASFLRLDNLTISYEFPHMKGISNLRAYVSGNNLFVITPYKGLDPEIQATNTGSNQAYIDVSYYGSAFYYKTRSVTFGLNVTF
ncbi:MAG: TonB-dependent receptor [Bacteroidetes bacterium]|nr:TonB-dependent receptor [Bacteroidota bacterium]